MGTQLIRKWGVRPQDVNLGRYFCFKKVKRLNDWKEISTFTAEYRQVENSCWKCIIGLVWWMMTWQNSVLQGRNFIKHSHLLFELAKGSSKFGKR